MRKHLLVVGGQNDSVAMAAFEADVTLFQVARLVTPQQIASSRRACVFDIELAGETVALARAFHALHPFDAVVSFLDAGLLSAAAVAEDLNIPGNLVRPVALTVDKLAMRALLNEHGLSPVPYRCCRSPSDVEAFLSETAGPIVLKPSRGSGSMGVTRIEHRAEIDEAFAWCKRSSTEPPIAEAYIDGQELSVETVTLDGRHHVVAITEKRTNGAPHFIEIGHCVPGRVSDVLRRRIEAMVGDLLDLIGHRAGPGHSELRIAADGKPVIIETHTRAAGGQICTLVELVCGVNLNRAACAHLLGFDLPPSPSRAPAAAIGFLAYESMTVREVRGVERARAIPGVIRVDCRLRAGQSLAVLASAKDRQGYVLAVGDTPEAAWDTVQRGLAEIIVIAEDQ